MQPMEGAVERDLFAEMQQHFAQARTEMEAHFEHQYAERLAAATRDLREEARRAAQPPPPPQPFLGSRVRPATPPTFTGRANQLLDWLFKLELYLAAVGIAQGTADAVTLAVGYLDGAALTWWRYRVEQVRAGHQRAVQSWDEFKTVVTSQFRTMDEARLARDRLRGLRQLGSVRDYAQRFQTLLLAANHARGRPRLGVLRGPQAQRPRSRGAGATQGPAHGHPSRRHLRLNSLHQPHDEDCAGERPRTVFNGAWSAQCCQAGAAACAIQRRAAAGNYRRAARHDAHALLRLWETGTPCTGMPCPWRIGKRLSPSAGRTAPGRTRCRRRGRRRPRRRNQRCCVAGQAGVEEGELKIAAAQASSSKTKESLPLSPADGTSHLVSIDSPELDLSVDESLGDVSAELRTLGQDMAHCLLVLEGKCFGNPVSVLVDSGATDDFVGKHFVDSQTNAPVMTCKPRAVKLADGTKCSVEYVVSAALQLGELHEARSLLVTELDGYDVILGKPWLTAHNPSIDWIADTVTVNAVAGSEAAPCGGPPRGQPVTLVGRPIPARVFLVSATQLNRELQSSGYECEVWAGTLAEKEACQARGKTTSTSPVVVGALPVIRKPDRTASEVWTGTLAEKEACQARGKTKSAPPLVAVPPVSSDQLGVLMTQFADVFAPLLAYHLQEPLTMPLR